MILLGLKIVKMEKTLNRFVLDLKGIHYQDLKVHLFITLNFYLSNIRQTQWEIGQVACVAQHLGHHTFDYQHLGHHTSIINTWVIIL